jgi:hypothetical protein
MNKIATAFIAVITFITYSNAQTVELSFPDRALDHGSVSATSTTNSSGAGGRTVKIDFVKTDLLTDGVTTTITYTGLENPAPRFFEAIVQASSEEECLATTEFPTVIEVGPERASLVYDRESRTNRLSWFGERRSSSCRVLIVRNSVDSSDLAVWKSNYGRTALFDAEGEKVVTESDAAAQRSRVSSVVVTFSSPVIN